MSSDDPVTGPEALALAARGLQAATGDAFFRVLAEHLARLLGAEIVLAGELVEDGKVRTLAMWMNGGLVPNLDYELDGTPCQDVVGRQTCAWGEGLQARFPRDRMLVEVGAQAYVGTPLVDAAARPIGILAALYARPQQDLSAARSMLEIFSARAGAELERRRAERALRESEERLELAVRAADLATWDRRLDQRVAVVNDRWHELFGYAPGEVEPTTDLLRQQVHPDDRPGLERALAEQAEGRALPADQVYRARTKSGAWRWVSWRARVLRDAAGKPYRLTGVIRDVTEQKRLEDDLLQARKLEALGSLAGGVAHDFNNLLTAILTAVDFAAETLPEGAPAREDLALAKEAATRAAELTRQLLAFARRQHVEPRVLDPNALVHETERLLRRTLGEDVRLVTSLASGAWPVRADPTQLQQVLLNLAVNARDAMPRGGVLTIETANVSEDPDGPRRQRAPAPGDWVRLCVSDDGEGMDPETAARVFEPFFTTKERGRGTGLGLATVYGIVAQAGGHVAVQSEPGVGSTFKVWLPRATPPPPGEERPRAEAEPRGGSEVILLVEDDPLVLSTAARALEAAGYEVIRARTGEEALAVVRERDVDLLVCDVVMPRMPGTAIAREVERLRPGVPVLFVSGYAAGAALGLVLRDRGDAFLPKPFTPRALGAKVREVLDRAGRARARRPG